MQGTFFGQTRISKSWLFTPPLHGVWAIALIAGAVAAPTLIRLGMPMQMDARACTIFCPFVLATSILCGWRYAIVMAVGSAIVRNALMGAKYTYPFTSPEMAAFASFLGYSACVILVVQLFRMTAARSLRQAGAKERVKGIVFSFDEGQAWASWYGIDARASRPVR
jgi:hypothetical protein